MLLLLLLLLLLLTLLLLLLTLLLLLLTLLLMLISSNGHNYLCSECFTALECSCVCASWDAIKYLIAEANYGGRITDDWDRRLCNVYVAQFFNEEILTVRPCAFI